MGNRNGPYRLHPSYRLRSEYKELLQDALYQLFIKEQRSIIVSLHICRNRIGKTRQPQQSRHNIRRRQHQIIQTGLNLVGEANQERHIHRLGKGEFFGSSVCWLHIVSPWSEEKTTIVFYPIPVLSKHRVSARKHGQHL